MVDGTTSGMTWTHSVPKYWNTTHRVLVMFETCVPFTDFEQIFHLLYSFFLGDSRVAEFYVPTFRNTVSLL